MTQILSFHKSHLPQLQLLINAHLGAAIPGWALPGNYITSTLESNPHEEITDPWVAERKTILGLVRDRVCAGAHILRYGDDTPWKGVCEIAWLLFWPEESDAGDSVLEAVHEQMQKWNTSEARFGGTFAIPNLIGTPDTWPHIADLLERSGYSLPAANSNQSIYGGNLDTIALPGSPPVNGLTIHRTLGKFGTRFSAHLDNRSVSQCECVSDLTLGGQLPALAGWSELTELETDASLRGQGIGTWVTQHAVEWLRLGKCNRVILNVNAEDESAGAGRFYERLGWTPFARLKNGWTRSSP